MKVTIGWSAETSSNVWNRADVTLEEEDFQALLHEYSTPVPTNVSPAAKFAVMKTEAERLIAAHMVSMGQESSETVLKLSSKKNKLLEKIYRDMEPTSE